MEENVGASIRSDETKPFIGEKLNDRSVKHAGQLIPGVDNGTAKPLINRKRQGVNRKRCDRRTEYPEWQRIEGEGASYDARLSGA